MPNAVGLFVTVLKGLEKRQEQLEIKEWRPSKPHPIGENTEKIA